MLTALSQKLKLPCTQRILNHVSNNARCHQTNIDLFYFILLWMSKFPQLFNSFGNCDYLLFHTSGQHENCHLIFGDLVLEVGEQGMSCLISVNYRTTWRHAITLVSPSSTPTMTAFLTYRFGFCLSQTPKKSGIGRFDLQKNSIENCLFDMSLFKGNCPSEACSEPCFDCRQEESECNGVR